MHLRVDLRPGRAGMRTKRAGVRPRSADLSQKRPDLRLERLNFWPEMPDLKPERPEWSNVGGDQQMNKRTDGLCPLLGHCPRSFFGLSWSLQATVCIPTLIHPCTTVPTHPHTVTGF